MRRPQVQTAGTAVATAAEDAVTENVAEDAGIPSNFRQDYPVFPVSTEMRDRELFYMFIVPGRSADAGPEAPGAWDMVKMINFAHRWMSVKK